MWAAVKSNDVADLDEWLGTTGVSIEALDPESTGATVLIYAAKNDLEEILDIVLELRNPKLDCADFSGYTALMHAAERGSISGVRRLLQSGAATTKKNNDGFSAEDLATRKRHSAVARIFELFNEDGGDIEEVKTRYELESAVDSLERKLKLTKRREEKQEALIQEQKADLIRYKVAFAEASMDLREDDVGGTRKHKRRRVRRRGFGGVGLVSSD